MRSNIKFGSWELPAAACRLRNASDKLWRGLAEARAENVGARRRRSWELTQNHARPLASCIVAAALVLQPVGAQEVGSARVVPIQVTGDAGARFSMVVLGDGYTAAEMPKFRAQVDRHLNVLWSIEPFRTYRNYINVYAVEIVSGDSGIRCDPEVRQQKTTPLRLQFGGGCTNPNARGITGDIAAARAYAAKATPHYDQILVLANTDTYGGIGGAVATTSGGNALGPLITPHELGHSLGRLQDEYTYSARGKPGGPYQGPEPASVHMTLLTEEEIRAGQRKWWRWLGEPSESGGTIARYEGGLSRITGIWRPSKHSMMISVGYYFDQISRERMTERISEQVALVTASTSTDTPLGRDEIVWIETPQPVYHELNVAWQVDGRTIPSAANSRYLNLGALKNAAPSSVTVTVVDPTEFVRDPEIRARALTAAKTWKVGSAPASPRPVEAGFTSSTQTDRAVGGRDVVYVVTTHPGDRVLDVTWRLNGKVVPGGANSRAFALGAQNLPAGTHRLSATLGDPGGTAGSSQTREWIVDNTGPDVVYALSRPLSIVEGPGASRHYFLRDEFTMKLDATDDQPGYVVAEFRVNGDGWHHYYGWPDAPPGTPFRFTPRGTTIKELVYGSLSREGLSPQPWEPREPGWGTHRIEYRGIDAAGNIGAPKSFRATLYPSPECTRTVSAPHSGELRVAEGVVCVNGVTISGPVTVSAGASLVAHDATIAGALTSDGAALVELIGTTIGELRISGTVDRVTLFASRIGGAAVLTDNRTARPMLLAGNTFDGGVTCTGNSAVPENGGTPNSFRRGEGCGQ